MPVIICIVHVFVVHGVGGVKLVYVPVTKQRRLRFTVYDQQIWTSAIKYRSFSTSHESFWSFRPQKKSTMCQKYWQMPCACMSCVTYVHARVWHGDTKNSIIASTQAPITFLQETEKCCRPIEKNDIQSFVGLHWKPSLYINYIYGRRALAMMNPVI